MIFFYYGVVLMFCIVGFAGLRVSSWHSQESVYWHRIALLVTWDPKQDEVYRPILTWAQANRPSFWTKAYKGWQSPAVRMVQSPNSGMEV